MRLPKLTPYAPAALALVLLILGAAGCEQKREQSAYGSTESLVFESLDGRPVHLADYKGKVVLLEFWTTWCPPCKAAIPDLNEIYLAYKGQGFEIVAAAVDEQPSKVGEFARAKGILYPVFVDNNDMNKKLGVNTVPTSFIIDREGRIVTKHMGYTPGTKELLIEEIRPLL